MSVTLEASMGAAAENINMRADPERKQRLQLAADLTHESLTSFVLSAADEKARQVLSEHRVTVLPAEFFDEFFDAVAADPNDALAELAQGVRPFQRR
jgi:uncharacterized protein (DUF1778 family)